MAITYAGGTGISTTSAARGTTSTSVAYTAVAANRMAILSVATKPSSATLPTPSLTDANGKVWTIIANAIGGTGSNANDTGPTRVAKYYRILDGTETGSVTIPSSGGSAVHGVMDVYISGTGAWATPSAVAGNDSTSGTNPTATAGVWGSASAVGDLYHVSYSADTDSTAAMANYLMSQSSTTFSNNSTGRSRIGNSSGFQGTVVTFDAIVATGANTNAPTFSLTWTAASSGPVAFVRLRERTAAAISTITDNFDDNTLTNPPWGGNYGTTSETGGRARVDVSTTFAGYQTVSLYSLDQFMLRAYMPAANGATGGYVAAWMQATIAAAGTDIGFYYELSTNSIWFASRVSYFDASAVIIPYDPVEHAWWRCRVSGADFIWETSPEGNTWTVRRTITAPAWVTNARTGRVLLEAHRDDGTANFTEFDSFNIVPAITVFQGSAALTAASGLSAGGTLNVQATTALTAASNLTASAIRSTAATAPLTAASSLTAAATQTMLATASLSAASNLSVSAVRSAALTAALTAASNLTASAIRSTATTAPLTAASSLLAAAAVATTATAPLSASSSLAVSATRVTAATAPLSAATSLAVAAIATARATSSLQAASELLLAPFATQAVSVALEADSGLLASATRVTPATTDLTGASNLLLAAVSDARAAAGLAASSDLDLAALHEAAGALTLTVAGQLDVAGVAERLAVLDLSVDSSLSVASPRLEADAEALLTAVSSLVAQGAVRRMATVSLEVESVLYADSGGNRSGAADLTADSNLLLAIKRSTAAGVIMGAETSLAVAGEVIVAATLDLSAATLLSVSSPLLTATATAVLNGQSNLAIATGALEATALLSALSNLTAGALRATRGQAALTAASGLQVAALRTLRATVAMSAASSLAIQLGGINHAGSVLMSAASRLTINLGSLPNVYAYPHQVLRTDQAGRLGRSTVGMIVVTSRQRGTIVKTARPVAAP